MGREDRNEIWLNFVLADIDDIMPDEITAITGLQPSKVFVKGAKRRPEKENSPVWPKSVWRLAASEDKYMPFEEQMDRLLSILEPKITLLKPLCDRYYCEFFVAIYIYRDNEESTPSVHLEKRHMKLMNELNAEFDVDLYCL